MSIARELSGREAGTSRPKSCAAHISRGLAQALVLSPWKEFAPAYTQRAVGINCLVRIMSHNIWRTLWLE